MILRALRGRLPPFFGWNMHNCPKCGGPLECLGGESAHPDNWYCEDVIYCGWVAWEKQREESRDICRNDIELLRKLVVEMREALESIVDKLEPDSQLARMTIGLIEKTRSVT